MFSGIIEEIGSLRSLSAIPDGQRLTIVAASVSGELHPGDSIAVDGICMSVTATDRETFSVEAVGTTIAKTTIADWRPDRRLNIERALRIDGRLNGHLVQGHVDGVAVVSATADQSAAAGGAFRLACDLPTELMSAVVREGSIAIDGVSLTIAELTARGVVLQIVPYTSNHTVLIDRRVGDRVNIELDIIGRYVERLLQGYQRT